MIVPAKPRRRTAKVFCIENWSSRMTDRTTVRPLLEALENEAGVAYIHRFADDLEDLRYLLERSSRYSDYSIVYLACHGAPGEITIGGKAKTLPDLAAELGDDALADKSVYFGSCETGSDRKSLKAFRDQVGAEIVCGYADPKGVDWLSAAAFELLLMQYLTGWVHGATGLHHPRQDPAGRALWKTLKFVTYPPTTS